MKIITPAALLLLLSFGSTLQAQKFYPDDPLAEDNDRLDTPVKPAEIDLGDFFDRFGHMFRDFGASALGSESQNVNTLDEVPDSSWFTNRHGVKRLTIEELKQGPNRGSGPNPEGTWKVIRGKSQGLTPGFQIVDKNNDRYVIKIDPVDVPEIASAAEIIATKIYHAIGYNVPENYIVYRKPSTVEIEPGTMVEDRFGDKVALTDFRFQRMIRRVPELADGSVRLVASKFLQGQLLGPFRYFETRSDDPNDVIPHEDRRELRGLRLIAAWTNHDDTRAQNTQDTWVEEGGGHYIRHYMMDFGSTFGSYSVGMQPAHLGFQYSMDFEAMKKNLVGFGIRVPLYRKANWPDFPEYQAVGRLEGELFDPEEWKNDYPNPAFSRMTARDAFWAAKIIMRFTREELEAVVATGDYSEEKDSVYFLDVLIERQQKCGEFGINGINPLGEFRVSDNTLEFANLSEKYGFSQGSTSYRIRWSAYNNEDDSLQPLRGPLMQTETRTELPVTEYLKGRENWLLLAEIDTLNEAFPHWDKRIGVYLRLKGSGFVVVGIERES
jgi:hypothetical protein